MEGELKANPENSKERVEAQAVPEKAPDLQPAAFAPERRAVEAPKAAAPERPSPARPEVTKDQQLQIMERILEDGLLDSYLAMSKEQRAAFRVTGESLASYARGFIGRAQAIRPHRLQQSVQAWLRSIAGVNRFWLIQAVKIKTDGLLSEIRGEDESYSL